MLNCKTKKLTPETLRSTSRKNQEKLLYIRRKEKILNYTVKKLLFCPAALAGSDRSCSTRCPRRKSRIFFFMQTKDVIKCKTKNLLHFNFKEIYQEMFYQANGINTKLHCKKTLVIYILSFLCSYPGRIRSL